MAGLKYWIWLSQLRGMNTTQTLAVLKYFPSPQDAYYAVQEEYAAIEGIGKRQIEALENKSLSDAEKIMEECDKLDIRILTYGDTQYPERLKTIFDPPIVLYYKGTWPNFDEEAAVAMVGTRDASPYGIQNAEHLAYEFTKCGAYVVSGLAGGIDAASHRGALRAGGRTAAVLGCGVDVRYPARNTLLYEDIEKSGVLISEYPPGTQPLGANFPVRNRIISGLCAATVVIEAGTRSGALITAHRAVDQGRDVFALPGAVDAPGSAGCNRLLQEGAGVVVRAWDVLETLQMRFPMRIQNIIYQVPPLTEQSAREIETTAVRRAQGEIKEKKNENKFDNKEEIEYIEIEKSKNRFTDDQIKILLTLSDQPVSADDLVEATQIPVRRVLSALTVLEIEDVIRQEAGSRFRLHATIQR